nr:TMV resistance protein N-like [Arachis hypogaea]
MSSSSYTTKYDVFISFRGEDTRETFTVHLFNALANKTIRAYMDCLLQRGDEVWPALEKAIESSLISIVVFSEKYATSKWCLEELVKILQWREYHGQVVISVFYRTDPSDIRNQSGSFEKAFAKYERDFAESLVGIEEIRKIVKVNMKQHRVIGIWGMRGIGKTTIAKMLFAKSFPHYDHVCYAENAKEYTPQRLLSELLRERITTDATGFVNSMSSLSNKKVLIILDNVKDSDQPLLEAVCEGYKSPQSRNSEPSFYAKLLVEIRMPHSHVKKLWEEKQELNNLEGNDLSECKELEELPDLSEAKRLRWDCSHLFEFPDNIDSLSKLRELRLDGSNVTWLPATIKCLQELEILSLNNCKFLETLPELPSSIKEFSADNCISLVFVSALNTLATKMVRKDETHLLQ